MAGLTAIVDKLLSGRYKIERQFAKEHARLNAIASNGKGASHNGKFYAAAQVGPDRPSPAMLTSPEDYKQAYERIVLIRMARQMEEDFPYTDLILHDFETYVVGDLRYVPNTGNRAADKKIRDFLEAKFDSVDYKGEQDLVGLAKLIVRGEKRDGEIGAIIIEEGTDIKLQLVPADCIGNPLIGANIGPNNYNGIRTNDAGQVEWYDIWRRLPHVNAYVFDRTVGASNFLHYYLPFRTNQYHGVTTFKNVIDSVYDVRQLIDFVKLNMKYRASQLPVVTNEQGRPRGTGYGDASPATNDKTGLAEPMTVDVGGVQQQYIKLGEGIVEFPNDFPNQQFLPAFGEIMRLIAMGCKLPPEFCYRSDSGGVLTRFHISKAERVFAEEQRRLKRFLRPYKNRVIEKGIQTGELDLSEFGDLATSPKRFEGGWQMGRSVSVDYGHETDSDIKLIEAGLMTKEEHMADNARDPEEVRAAIKSDAIAAFNDANEVARATGRTFEEALPFVIKKFPNPVMEPAAKEADKAKPTPTSL